MSRTATAVRIILGALIITAFVSPSIMDSHRADNPVAIPLQLVDETRDGGTTDTPGIPSPSPSTSEQSPSPSGKTPQPGEAPTDETEDTATGVGGMPVAAQAGLSLGVILLAAVALIPGRRPPPGLRAG